MNGPYSGSFRPPRPSSLTFVSLSEQRIFCCLMPRLLRPAQQQGASRARLCSIFAVSARRLLTFSPTPSWFSFCDGGPFLLPFFLSFRTFDNSKTASGGSAARTAEIASFSSLLSPLCSALFSRLISFYSRSGRVPYVTVFSRKCRPPPCTLTPPLPPASQ